MSAVSNAGMSARVTRIQLKSSIIRVTNRDGGHRITGFVLNDGTALKSIEIKIDDGAWQKAKIDSDSTQYSWKAVSSRLGQCSTWRAYAYLTGHRHQRAGPGNDGSDAGEAVALGKLRTVLAYGDHRVDPWAVEWLRR